jgi:hypothetical protein
MLKNIKNFPIDGHLFTFYDHSNHLIYLTRAGSDQILILQFDLVNESICLSQRVILSQRSSFSHKLTLSIKTICQLPVQKLNRVKNEIAKYHINLNFKSLILILINYLILRFYLINTAGVLYSITIRVSLRNIFCIYE